jgi:hypothetical protein
MYLCHIFIFLVACIYFLTTPVQPPLPPPNIEFILNDAFRPYQHLTFQFFKAGTNVRRSFAKQVKSIFINQIVQKYGGWISRLYTEDGMRGLYEVHIFARSDNMAVDTKFTALWEFMHHVLEVTYANVTIGLMAADVDPNFKEKFVIRFSDDHNDWSQRDNFSDTDSVFSTEVVEDI